MDAGEPNGEVFEERTIAERIRRLKASIQEIAERSKRPADSIRFILVTKKVASDKIREALEAGIQDLGENRVQEFLEKKEELPSEIHWHFVGRLQNNKVKYLIDYLKMNVSNPILIQSLDRMELAQEIEHQAQRKTILSVPCLIQVKSSGEKTKGGFLPEEVTGFVSGLSEHSPIDIRGLMTIGPLTEDEQEIRKAFRAMKQLQEGLKKQFSNRNWDILSMGMSSDYEIAIEEGANLLRIGTAIFGSRREE